MPLNRSRVKLESKGPFPPADALPLHHASLIALPEICIVYASKDRTIVQALVMRLSISYNVWWDDDIRQGDFRTVIESKLSQAKCVVAVWSRESRQNRYVVDEVEYATKASVPVLPVLIEDVSAPLGFGGMQQIDLISWKGREDHPGLDKLLRSLSTLVPKSLEKSTDLRISGGQFPFPLLFHSVSSHETQMDPANALHLLGIFGTKAILASAYDTANRNKSVTLQALKTVEELRLCQAKGALVLLDSGNYEASRKGDRSWSTKLLHEALTNTPHDLAFCFDDLDPPEDARRMTKRVITAVERESRYTTAPVLPIVHARRKEDGVFDQEGVRKAIVEISRVLKPALIAIPERELGDGIFARAANVQAIRRDLNQLGFYQPIHLLGTGNPMSIAILSAAGADSFDGLEWCRVAVDGGTGNIFHFHQYDFCAFQDTFAQSVYTRGNSVDTGLSFGAKVLLHNLEFFTDWMADLLSKSTAGKVETFLSQKLPRGTMQQLNDTLQGGL